MDELEQESVINKAGAKGLGIMELEFGLNQTVVDIEERRERLKAKLRGSGTTTPQMVKNIALAFDCGDIDIIFIPSEYKVKIKYVSKKGVPKNENDFKKAIQDIMPAHLVLEYLYTYTTWNFIKLETWNNLSGFTWQEVNTM